MKCKKAISFQNVYFSYEKKLPSILRFFKKKSIINYNLKNLNFEIAQGDFVGLLGLNGSGKSTILKLASKIYAPNLGNINLFDKNPKVIIELGIGKKLDKISGYEVAKQIILFSDPSINNDQVRLNEKVNLISNFTELGTDFYKPIYTYSTGMAARLYFSIALIDNYSLIIIDEILAVGDLYFVEKCMHYLIEIKQKPVTSIIASHNWDLLMKLCNKAMIIENKCTKRIGNTKDTVIKYLSNFQKTSKSITTIKEKVLQSKKNVTIEIVYKINTIIRKPLFIKFSVEKFKGLYNWEIIMLPDPIKINKLRGSYKITYIITKDKLINGNYIISYSFFHKKNSSENEILVSNSWLNNKGIEFTIKNHSEVFKFPVTVRVKK